MQLSPKSIEHIHDVLVGVFLPFDEKINPAEYRDVGLIESAAARPFHTACGVELWPSVPEKAAALFHSLACNHCFINGNKRTAVIALDLFLMLNDHLLTMNSDEVYQLAKTTAKANEDGRSSDDIMRELVERIGTAAVDMQIFEDLNIQHRLGADLERILTHVRRVKSFAAKIGAQEKQFPS